MPFHLQGRLSSLLIKQEEERKRLEEETEHLAGEERAELLRLMEAGHTEEQSQLSAVLKLEQDEQTEKLRKVRLRKFDVIVSF